MYKQVSKDHYGFESYITRYRWSSLWHQLSEMIKLEPKRILEVGPGSNIFKAVATELGYTVQTADIDPDLDPDHICSLTNLPFDNDSFDLTCAFQVLEHLPFKDSVLGFAEMARISSKAIIISLPDAQKSWLVLFQVPFFGTCQFHITLPQFIRLGHKFDGQHYWELNKRGFALGDVIKIFEQASKFRLEKTYRVASHPYHRFFVFQKPESDS